jgi:PPP family 3-phenylpropionic acid transporter
MPRPEVPTFRLAAFYFAHFTAVGMVAPYLGPYLKTLGFSPSQIGELTALLVAGRMVAPTLWGWIADHTGRRMGVVRVTTLLAAASAALLLIVKGYVLLGVTMALFGFFWSASLPQFEAVTLNHLGTRIEAYARIRVWGSIGFIVTATAFGVLLQGAGMATFPQWLVILVGVVWLAALCTPEGRRPPIAPVREALHRVIARPPVFALLAVVLLMQWAHGPYYAFYTIFLEEHGYTRMVAGQLWSLGVAAEVVLFLVMHRLLPAWGLRRLMLTSLFAGTVRWLLVAYGVDSIAGLVAAQCLHAATFGMHHVAAVQLVHHHFTGRHQGRGQALYSSVAYGFGGAIGAMTSGHLWVAIGGPATYALAAMICAIAGLVAWRWLERDGARPATTPARVS